MLTEQRQEEILRLLNQKGSVTLQELKEYFHASESTIRRDLNALDREEQVSQRQELYREEKNRIGRYAASLVGPEDFVYLDAGTTTGAMIPYLTEHSAAFVTNAVSHALHLAENGFRVILIGGEVKAATEAIVGNEAYVNLKKFNFTKGFWGTNGVSPSAGFSTPDINEAMVKECALLHTQQAYILCDSSKFYHTSPVTFGEFEDGIILTDRLPDESFQKYENIVVVP